MRISAHDVQKSQNALTEFSVVMSKTVKARVHHGADSLDLTIPAEVVRDYNVNSGDVFEISIRDGDNELEIEYKRVYRSDTE